MIVLIGIAVVFLLVLVLEAAEQRPGFTTRHTSRSTDHDRDQQWAIR